MLKSVLQPLSSALHLGDLKKDDSIPQLTISVTEITEPEEDVNHQSTLSVLGDIDINSTHIQSSPYADPVNHLDLRDLTLQERLLAISLTKWQATRPDYATAPYMEAFNFSAMFSHLRSLCEQAGITWQRQEFYLVIFRSKLRTTADRNRLGELDKNSHEEACASGGLLHYWFGSPDTERRNLATCIWRNREDAAAGGKGPEHRKARGAAREMYEEITFNTHKFVVGAGAETWCLGPYRG